ncbi:MAG: sugar transferase [Eubacteriales bacterium]
MYRFFFKRVLDIIVSLIALPFVLVISLILSVVIFFNDGGMPFYFAERLGKNGKAFKMYKLRTMKKNMPDLRNPDGSTYNSEDDYRLTSCGKWIRRFSLDELPQVLNVLKGEMSLVGPRPDLPSQEKFYVGNERDKLLVRPGITGYSQAYFRNSISWKERIGFDIFYIQNVSFIMDMKIILKTVTALFQSKNIYNTAVPSPCPTVETVVKG